MVLEDPFAPNTSKRKDRRAFQKSAHKLAAPFDRLTAFLIDLLFLFPLVNIVFAPFHRESLRAYLFHFEEQASFYIALGVITLAIVFILYFAVIPYLFGATPGKKIMGLRVICPEENSQLRLSQSVLRSIGILGEMAVMGLPLLGAFRDKLRRPLHDRIADTIVVSDRTHFLDSPSAWEKKLANSAYLSFALFIVCLFVPFLFNKYKNYLTLDHVPSGNTSLCEVVDQNLPEWDQTEGRLEVAMTLYAAGAVDEECLGREADFMLWSGEESALAYLAKAFSLSDSPSLSDRYLEKVCKVDDKSQSCFLSELVGHWMDGKWKSVTSQLKEKILESQSFIKVWAIRHFFTSYYFSEVEDLLESLPRAESLGEFTSSYRTKTLFKKGQKEMAQVAFESSVENLKGDSRLSLAAWYCSEANLKGCSADYRSSCQHFSQLFKDQWDYLNDQNILLSYLRTTECSENVPSELAKLKELEEGSEIKYYLESLNFLNTGKKEEALKQLRRLVSLGLDSSRPLSYEAALKWLNFTDEDKDFETILGMWDLDHSRTKMWENLGQALIERLFQEGDLESSYKRAQKIVERRPFNERAYKVKAIYEHKNGQLKSAWQSSKRILEVQRNTSLGAGRSPASTLQKNNPIDQRWNRVQRDLRKRFDQ